MNLYTLMTILLATMLAANASAQPVKEQEGHPTIQLNASFITVKDNVPGSISADMGAMGVNLGYDYGLSDVVSIRPNVGYGLGMYGADNVFTTNSTRLEYSIEVDSYSELGFQFNLYVSKKPAFMFYAGWHYMKYTFSQSIHTTELASSGVSAHANATQDTNGFAFEIGAALHLTRSSQLAASFQKGTFESNNLTDSDITTLKVQLTYLF